MKVQTRGQKKKKVRIMSEGVKAVGRETNKGLMDDQQWMAAGVRERLREGKAAVLWPAKDSWSNVRERVREKSV